MAKSRKAARAFYAALRGVSGDGGRVELRLSGGHIELTIVSTTHSRASNYHPDPPADLQVLAEWIVELCRRPADRSTS